VKEDTHIKLVKKIEGSTSYNVENLISISHDRRGKLLPIVLNEHKNIYIEKNIVFNINDRELVADYVVNLESQDIRQISRTIERSWTEVCNGNNSSRLVFSFNFLSLESVLKKIRNALSFILSNSDFIWPIKYLFSIHDGILSLISFYNLNTDLVRPPKPLLNGKLKQAFKLLSNLPKINELSFELQKIDTSLVFSSLKSEIFTKYGLLDTAFIYKGTIHSEKEGSRNILSKIQRKNDLLFEDRIDVDAYNFYELVHPAYAKQCVFISSLISNLRKIENPLKCLDIGSGTGAPIMMMLELIPELCITAIEPSPIAFKHLKRNLQVDNRVTCVNIDYLKFNTKDKFPVIFSIGASHHLNTNFFFQKTYTLLAENGLFMVSDEFVSKYENTKERCKNLIIHHTGYMVDVMFSLNRCDKIPFEYLQLISWFQNEIPVARYYAYNNRISESINICKKLLSKSKSLNLSDNFIVDIIPYYRLQLLELEALCAGLDYEVEQKTYTDRFVRMAEATGFELYEHYRIFATDGNNINEAGTHVFCFRKKANI